MLSRLRGAVWNMTCRPGKWTCFFFPFDWTRVFRVPFRPVIHPPPITKNLSRTGAGKELLDEEKHAENIRWESLTTREKIGDWALRHQYPIIVGSWAASLGVAAAIIMKDKHQTPSQKASKISSTGRILIN